MVCYWRQSQGQRQGQGQVNVNVKSGHLTEFGYSMVQCLSCEVTKYYKQGNKKGIKFRGWWEVGCGSFPEYGEGFWENWGGKLVVLIEMNSREAGVCCMFNP